VKRAIACCETSLNKLDGDGDDDGVGDAAGGAMKQMPTASREAEAEVDAACMHNGRSLKMRGWRGGKRHRSRCTRLCAESVAMGSFTATFSCFPIIYFSFFMAY
jgi:hypothetical protein